MRQSQLWASVALVGVTAAWGATFVVVQIAVESMAVNDFLFWRFSLAALVLAAINPRGLRRLAPSDWRHGLILAALLAAAYIAQTVGLQYTAASVSGFITGMILVFTPLISAVVLKKRIAPGAWLAVALATVGLGLLSLQGFSVGLGEAVTLLAAFIFAVHLVYLGEWSTPSTAYGLTILQLAGAAAITGVAATLDGQLDVPDSEQLWLIVGFMAIVATMLAYLLQTWAIPVLGSVRGAVLLTLEPVFAGIFGVWIAGDAFTWRVAIGGLLIIAAMLLVELVPRAQPPAGARSSPDKTSAA